MNETQFKFYKKYLVTKFLAEKQQLQLLFKVSKDNKFSERLNSLHFPTVYELREFSNIFPDLDEVPSELFMNFLIDGFWSKFEWFIRQCEESNYEPGPAFIPDLEDLKFPSVDDIKQAIKILIS